MQKLLVVAVLSMISFFWPLTVTAADNAEVLKALARTANAKIPRQNLHCEMNGTKAGKDGGTVFNDVTVGDVFASYAAWSMASAGADTQSLSCDGKTLLKCQWIYNENQTSEKPSGQVFLRFEYDPKLGKINPQKLECEQVP